VTTHLQVEVYRRSFGQSVLVSGTLFGPATNFSSFVELFLDGYWFNDVGRFLRREVASVVLSWAHLIDSAFETPPTWRVMFLYLFPQEQGSPVVCCHDEVLKYAFSFCSVWISCKTRRRWTSPNVYGNVPTARSSDIGNYAAALWLERWCSVLQFHVRYCLGCNQRCARLHWNMFSSLRFYNYR
jgi:hypothetical protein